MTTADITIDLQLSDAEHRMQLRRALIASTVGTTIEWYDFLLYGTVSALVFGPLFFPAIRPADGGARIVRRSSSSALSDGRSERRYLAITATGSAARQP